MSLGQAWFKARVLRKMPTMSYCCIFQALYSYSSGIKREMYTSSLFLGFQQIPVVRDASILPDKQSDTGKIYLVRISAFLDLLQASVSDLGEWQLHS